MVLKLSSNLLFLHGILMSSADELFIIQKTAPVYKWTESAKKQIHKNSKGRTAGIFKNLSEEEKQKHQWCLMISK